MVRKILSSLAIFSIIAIGFTGFANDANAGGRHHNHGGNSWGAFAAGTFTGFVLDRILTPPQVVYGHSYPTQTVIIQAPQPPVVVYQQPQIIIVPVPQQQGVIFQAPQATIGFGIGQGGANLGDVRAQWVRNAADNQAWNDAAEQCRVHGWGSPFCGVR
ncbi:MAG: hypothetical protein HYT93_02265 [Parcubacteria group bacterium]|nr:hypothetical protein [Parcubacteria group bacterium]